VIVTVSISLAGPAFSRIVKTELPATNRRSIWLR
jgi:hypothetical protein